MIDFSSALYLGMRHPSRSLRPWRALTTGLPAVLADALPAMRVVQELAALQGFACGTLGSSTFHLFWDLFGSVRPGTTIYVDDGIYPIAWWGVERAAARGAHVRVFGHHRPEMLARLLERHRPAAGPAPWIVADGYCPGCGRAAPIAAYRECAVRFNGVLLIDDTQALGILGEDRDRYPPFGRGGGGTLRWSGAEPNGMLVVSSLAKGFGAPMAVLAGDAARVRGFERVSETRVHCSPPSMAVIHAAGQALAINRSHGDTLRARLAQLVARFRTRLEAMDLTTVQDSFPVQTLRLPPDVDPGRLHDDLLAMGLRGVLHRLHRGERPALSFVIGAAHTVEEIDCAAACIFRALHGYRAGAGQSKPTHIHSVESR